jgi:hypothetical protein
MALISEQINSLINGVSQQPPTIRLGSQCEEQINGLVTVAEGLKKRPPLEHVAKISNKTDTDAKVHWIDRDENERYAVIVASDQFSTDFSSDFTGSEIEISDLEGASQSITGGDSAALGYMTTANARDNLKLFTIADYTFILNKNTTVAKSTETTATRNHEAIVFLKQASSAQTFKILIDGASVGGITSNNNATTMTGSIFDRLDALSGFTATEFDGSNVHISKDDGTDFTIHAKAPETNMIAIKDTIADFSDLPSTTKDGFTIKVTGEPEESADDYWVKHVNQNDADRGEWVETVEPGLANELDQDTMPHKLIKNPSTDPWDDAFDTDFGSEDFSVSPISWIPREVGDTQTVPDPSFVGQTINDMFFHKNRFGFLSNENIVLSELGEFFNFYHTTATDLLDTDIIDLASPSNEVSILQNAIAYSEDLYIFSDFAQFKLSEFAAGGLTPANAKLSLITQYEHDKLVRPIVLGRKIYFADTADGFTTIREFGLIEDLQEQTAEDVTGHIPSYIPGNGYELVGHDGLMFVLSTETDERNTIYPYKFLFQRGEKKLSSWSKWVFKASEKVIGLRVFDEIAYFVIVRPDGTYLDKMSLQDANLQGLTPSTTQLPFKVHLDRLVELTGSYNSGNDETTWTLPYPDGFGDTFQVIQGPAWESQEGRRITGVTQPTETTLVVSGDYSAHSCFVGKEYEFRYEFTEPTIKDSEGSSKRQRSVPGGVLKIRKFNVNYFKTGYFEFKVTPENRDAYTYVFTGRALGSILNNVGTVPFNTGSFKKLILTDAKELTLELISSSYLPCAFTGADWEGNYVVRTVPRR